MVIFASSRLNATPEMSGCSMSCSSGMMRVPSPSTKVESTLKGTLYLLANSTARICSTLAPKLASSSISSWVISFSRRASGTTRGSEVYTPSTSVNIWHSSAPSAAASATAVVSEPPRPSVVMSPSPLMP